MFSKALLIIIRVLMLEWLITLHRVHVNFWHERQYILSFWLWCSLTGQFGMIYLRFFGFFCLISTPFLTSSYHFSMALIIFSAPAFRGNEWTPCISSTISFLQAGHLFWDSFLVTFKISNLNFTIPGSSGDLHYASFWLPMTYYLWRT